MTLRTSATASLWLETGPEQPEHPEHDHDLETDIVVLGGGIVGVTTALLLKEAGARVVLLEAGRIGHGVTGHTTAKVSSQHGMAYSRLASRFGAGAAATYGAANEAALRWIADRVRADDIDCDFRHRPSYAYVTEDRAKASVRSRNGKWVASTTWPAFTRPPGVLTERPSWTSTSTARECSNTWQPSPSSWAASASR